jgi:hypothetical protein
MTSKDHEPYRRQGKTRELYEDADTEQREGSAVPDNEPMRDVIRGKASRSRVERPADAAERPARRR